MPYLLIISGIVLLVAGVKNTTSTLFGLLSKDFSGQGSFLSWALAIAIIGGFGYIEELRPLSRMFMALVVVVLILKHGGVFEQFNQELLSTPASTSGATTGVGTGFGGGGGNAF